MAPISAAVLLPAAMALLIAMDALKLSVTAAAAAPPPIGQPGCSTICGNISVPYPLGFGASRCYWLGLNLTCGTSDSNHPPRLLLGDGSLRVAQIYLRNQTVRVTHTGSIINTTGDFFTSDGWNASLDFGRGFKEQGYLLSSRNELVASGCNVMATLSADVVGEEATKIISGCASFCTKRDTRGGFLYDDETDKNCTGTSGEPDPLT